MRRLLQILVASITLTGIAFGQAATTPPPAEQASVPVPDSDRLRIRLKAMAALFNDGAIATLGFERQGRIGYVIVTLSGKISDKWGYVVDLNPVNETKPLPSCGEEFFFYPNNPAHFSGGPKVECHPDGRLRVDDYRFIALDLIPQQGPVRQAYIQYAGDRFAMRFGRFVLPIGFNWEEAGSFTSKDATHIQRINAAASFGVLLSFSPRLSDDGSRRATFHVGGVLGEGNRYRDYAYFYFADASLDTNSGLTAVASASVVPARGLELRAAYQFGDSASKVERLPNFFASKRRDNALVLSGQYQPVRSIRVFGEYARYQWGLRDTSARLLGLNEDPLYKPGYYAGVDLSAPIRSNVRVGTVVTREELSRDDSLVKLMSETGALPAALGKKERSLTARIYAEFGRHVTVALFRNDLSNPFPWLSGITPVGGPRAFQPDRGSDKFGLVVRFQVP